MQAKTKQLIKVVVQQLGIEPEPQHIEQLEGIITNMSRGATTPVPQDVVATFLKGGDGKDQTPELRFTPEASPEHVGTVEDPEETDEDDD
jgi:hypothetical protein